METYVPQSFVEIPQENILEQKKKKRNKKNNQYLYQLKT
jgi:hypothetical protein